MFPHFLLLIDCLLFHPISHIGEGRNIEPDNGASGSIDNATDAKATKSNATSHAQCSEIGRREIPKCISMTLNQPPNPNIQRSRCNRQ